MPEKMLHARTDGRLSRPHRLHRVPARSPSLLDRAFAAVVANFCDAHSDPFVPALGMRHEAFLRLLAARYPEFDPSPAWLAAQQESVAQNGVLGEFPDLLQLLLEHRAYQDEQTIAHLVATACMGDGHLWQDLGLPDRTTLGSLLARHFPVLAEKNSGDMKWKKFFYKQLCVREGISACRSPSCAACCDHAQCFGPED